jgi:hypothetical protein
VLTAVGLLPIAAAGIDIDQMMAGAAAAALKYNNADLSTMYPNGGSSYLARAREKIKKDSFRQQSILQLICTPWDNMYKKVAEISLKQYLL